MKPLPPSLQLAWTRFFPAPQPFDGQLATHVNALQTITSSLPLQCFPFCSGGPWNWAWLQVWE
ncbi:hypothetical protein Mapa_012915 [Marchantia paleacea]|nr:hypothetical protein Mapa_012915 [Marchantia paleacea]